MKYGRLNDADTAKLHNIVDMGLSFSAMIRLFDKGSKRILRDKIINEVQKVVSVESQKQFDEAHTNFCTWGILRWSPKFGQVVKVESCF
jgi:hypothetical protein